MNKYKSVITESKARWFIISELLMKYELRTMVELGASKGDNARNILWDLRKNNYGLLRYYLIDISINQKIATYGETKARLYYYNDFYLGVRSSCIYIDKGSIESAKEVKEKVDFVWVDADTTSTQAIKKDIETWLPKLKVGGIIGGRYVSLKRENIHTYYILPLIEKIFGAKNLNFHSLIEQNSGREDYMWWFQK